MWLVVFGDRVIVVQAESKRLTLMARKGNESCPTGRLQECGAGWRRPMHEVCEATQQHFRHAGEEGW